MHRQTQRGDFSTNDSHKKHVATLQLRSLLHCMVLVSAARFADGFQLPSTSIISGRTPKLGISIALRDPSSSLTFQALGKDDFVGHNGCGSLRSHPSFGDEFSSRNIELSAATVATVATDSSTGSLEPNHIADRIRRWGLKRRTQRRETLSKPSYQWTKQNFAIALPALVGLLTDPLLSMVDTAFVGRSAAGAVDLAALGVCTSIFHMAFTIFRASTVATTSLVGSASTPEEKRQITKISLGFAGVMGTLVLLALRVGGGHMLTAMGVSPTSPMYKSACSYLFTRCWAAPAVVGIVVAEGAFRGNGDNKTPLIAASVAAVLNLVLDPLFMFTFGMGMTGAAAATAISQLGAAALFAWRLSKRRLLPQPQDRGIKINVGGVVKSIISANAAMLSKSFSMLVFYTCATSVATRIGAAHVATHQVCLSLFWLATMWLDSGGVSAQLLLSRTIAEGDYDKVRSLTKYMLKFALAQGLTFSALVFGAGKFVPGAFTQDPTVIRYIIQCLPHLAIQQTIVSLCLVLEGLAIGGNQFRSMASGTAVATAAGLWQMSRATSVLDIWATAVNTFFGIRLINGIIGVSRVHIGLKKKMATTAVQTTITTDTDASTFVSS
jgi:putative MATE family efflux protein